MSKKTDDRSWAEALVEVPLCGKGAGFDFHSVEGRLDCAIAECEMREQRIIRKRDSEYGCFNDRLLEVQAELTTLRWVKDPASSVADAGATPGQVRLPIAEDGEATPGQAG